MAWSFQRGNAQLAESHFRSIPHRYVRKGSAGIRSKCKFRACALRQFQVPGNEIGVKVSFKKCGGFSGPARPLPSGKFPHRVADQRLRLRPRIPACKKHAPGIPDKTAPKYIDTPRNRDIFDLS